MAFQRTTDFAAGGLGILIGDGRLNYAQEVLSYYAPVTKAVSFTSLSAADQSGL
jgi:hypothetical protein